MAESELAQSPVHREVDASRDTLAARIFPGEGELARLCRARDWSATPLGPLEQWPQALRHAAALVMETPSAMVLLWGPQLVQVYNDAYRAVMGRKHPAGLGQPTRDCWPEAWHFNEPIYQLVLAQAQAFRFEDQPLVLERNGYPEALYFRLTYSPLRGDAGEVAGVLVTLSETTAVVERLQAQRALAESEQRFRQMTDAVPQIIWITDATGKVEFFNRQWQVYTGSEAPSSVSEVADQALHPDDVMPTLQRFGEARRAGGTFRIEHRIRSVTGDYRWFLVRAEPDKDPLTGEVRRWFGTSIDIHDRRMAEQALRTRQRELRMLMDNTPNVLSRFDRQLRFAFINRAVEEALGRRPEHFIGRTCAEAGLPPDFCQDWEAAVRQVFATGEPLQAEFSFRGHRTGLRHFVGRLVPEFGASGQLESVLGVLSDWTTERAAIGALREADRRKDEFLATLAHELRNPLAPLRAGVQILRATTGDAQRPRRTLDMMDRQLRHMVHLIDDLLDVARISRGKLALRRERVCLREVLDIAVESARPTIEAGGHELAVALPEARLEVDGDRTRLAQVVGNLLNNAAKYTPPGGHISLTARREGAEAVVAVQDDGCGIEPDMLGRVFEMFVQGPDAAGRAQGGLGIGLPLARQLVRMHGGSIGVESEGPGRGALFEIRLPLADAPVAPAPAVATVRRLQVLVVDDNIEAAATLATMLGLLGQDARAVHSGEAALAHVRQFAPAMVFCDLDMPGMDGCELARRLRRDPATHALRLVAVSGWGAAEDKRRASDAGFDAHVTKPVDLAALERLVAAAPLR